MRKGEHTCVKGRGRKEKGSWKNEKKKRRRFEKYAPRKFSGEKKQQIEK